jgi:hypothetical protein
MCSIFRIDSQDRRSVKIAAKLSCREIQPRRNL